MIKVRGYDLPVDVKTEIEDYDWGRPNWKGDRLIANSPFREENSPSFAVNFENGTFIDSGGDGDYRKGDFVKLLAFLRNESREETEDHLLSIYSTDFANIEKLELPAMDGWFDEERNTKIFDRDELNPYQFSHPYLEGRGIPANVQRAFDVGYEPRTKSVVLVWHDLNGNVVSWKHRNVHNKLFWYVKGGQPIRNHLYGIHWVVKRQSKIVWIVESEIDALTLWSKGIAAVAIGTSSFPRTKRDLILKAGIETLVIATDNDDDGRKAKRMIVESLGGRIHLQEIGWDGINGNDINEARDDIGRMKIEDIDLFAWDED